MKRFFKFVASGVLGLLTLAAVASLVIAIFPATVLNTRYLSCAVRYFGRDYRPSWVELALNVTSPSLLTKRAVLTARDLCVDEIHGFAQGCLRTLEIDATVRFGLSPLVSVTRLERAVVHTGDIHINSSATRAVSSKKKNSDAATTIPSWARSMTVGEVDVRVPRAVLVSSSGTTIGGVTAALHSESSALLTADVYTILKSTGTKKGKRYDANIAFESVSFREGRLASLNAKIRARGADGLTADARVKLEPQQGGRLQLTASAQGVFSGRALEAKLSGEGGKDGGRAAFNIAVSDRTGPLRRAAFDACEVKAGAVKKTGYPEYADLRCRITLLPAPFGSSKGLTPKALTGTLSLHGKTRAQVARRDRFETRVDIKIWPVEGYGGFLLVAEADLAGSVGGSFAEERRIKAKAAIDRFGEVVRFFDGTEYALPAPINALDGAIDVAAEFTGRAGDERSTVEYDAKTDLASAKQKLIAAVKGSAVIQPSGTVPRFKIQSDVDLKRVVLELPYLELKGNSSPIPDKRIKTGEPKRDAVVDAARLGAARPVSDAVDYDVSLRTLTPIILSSNLVKAPIPVSLDVRAKPAGLSGTIRVEGFNMEVFRQNARIDHITFTPAPGGAATALDGKIVYKRNEVTVNILLLGTTAKPSVVFESDPPMSQDEIVAFVLYGKTPNDLDSDQKASAGNATNAMASGAFGLASLYLFASTPVDSVGYDSATQSYQVKFKLPGGATLAVGSNLQESRTLSLRKRLARHWELQTEAGGGSRDGNTVTTFLQWFTRY